MDVLVDYIQELNWLAVVVATVAAMAIGAIWYTPKVFGNTWMKAIGLKEKDIQGNGFKPMLIAVVTSFVTAVALGVLLQVLALTTVLQGALFGALVAAAFIATNKIMQSQFEQRSASYAVVTVACDVVTLAVMGAILAVWS